MGTGLDQIDTINKRASFLLKALHDANFTPDSVKNPNRLFPMKEAQRLIGRSAQTIHNAESDGRLPQPERGENNRRLGFSLADINRARDLFKTHIRRGADEQPVIIGVSNLKGGVSKTTLSVHLAEFLSLRGYRVLIVDTDPQASCTQTFGFNPDYHIKENETLAPFLRGQENDLEYAIKPISYWGDLHLIPSNLFLHNAELEMAREIGTHTFQQLDIGIQSIKHNYDVIIIDPAPAMGFLSLNVLYAVNGLLIPTPAAMYDFYSTLSFLKVLQENMEILETHLGGIEYHFTKLVITRYDESKSAQSGMVEFLEENFSNFMLNARMKESAEIINAANQLKTVYELNAPVTSHKTYKRCINFLDALNLEIEVLIRSCWPSHTQQLRHAAVI